MSSLQDYFLAIDGKIKGHMLEIASLHDLRVKFTGYYIENNSRTGSFSPQPFYLTYKEYREECPYEDVTHVRYFFELTKGDEKHVATVHLGAPDFYDIHFSIEELVGGVEIRDPEHTHLSDFDLLMSYVKTKFS
ncbi:hypothetical protein [Pseudotamlana agarivorans]|uniref:hypothetical protein n=1 Tax=Pseudotamlana agarivorans TaxID=481183 RepID=UPI000832076A|nr:hypothetical protein [Tamlana agarivorans]